MVSAFIHAADWMPTITRLAEWRPPEGLKWDGADVWPVLSGRRTDLPSRAIYVPFSRGCAVIRDGWKLIAGQAKGGQKVELYNVMDDPSEKEDLAAREPARAAGLKRELEDLRKDDLPGVPADLKGAPEK